MIFWVNEKNVIMMIIVEETSVLTLLFFLINPHFWIVVYVPERFRFDMKEGNNDNFLFWVNCYFKRKVLYLQHLLYSSSPSKHRGLSGDENVIEGRRVRGVCAKLLP